VLNSVPFTQFYHINYDLQNPYMVCGGLQDNGTWCGPSNSLLTEGIRKNDWFTVGGGDGFFAVPDLKEPWRVYTDLQGGVISVIDTRSGASKAISPYPNRIGSVGDAMENHKFRYNWNSPIAISPQDGQTVYFGGNVLFKSTNHGQSWTQISQDLTTNDKSKQKSSGGPIVTDNTAAEFYCTIITIAPSPVDPNVIWVGTDDGNVQVTRDGGKSWTNAIKNVQGLAPNAWIPTVEASHFDAGTAYFAADHHQDNDYTAYFFKTTDFGKTWTRLTIGEPKTTGWPHVIREDPKVKTLLYAGTELGLWVSFDSGANWASLRQNMPPVPVRDIQVQPRENDLLVATHGRGLYVMDDITALQHVGEAMKTDAELFDVRAATRWNLWGKDGNLGQAVWKAPNPPEGAIIDYYLKADQKDDPIVTIADKAGKTIRTLRNAPKKAGVNRVTWDLRYDGPHQIAGAAEDEENPYRFAGGPYVIPGDYTIKIHAAGRELTKTVKVAMDPRVPVSTADLQTQLDAALTLRDMMSKANLAIEHANSLIEQLSALSNRLKKQPGSAALQKEVAAALDTVTKLRDEQLTRPYPSMGYRQYPRVSEEIRSLSGSVSRAQAKPTDPESGRMKELTAELDKDVAALNQIVGGPISAINETMRSAPFIITEIIK
ncbi:MAG TPA: hypothetical protein VHU82_15735, partial [Vicinamibacterales bacterium]|nr:hypothetical protein [Vicinamibacterales bacterium]